jgi:23S rRNA (cytidine1920-2'-O)/16S rRNA (cytidine1409-2'-O)-methyltransferase
VVEKKVRLDLLLVQKGLVKSREKAKALIMAGKVFQGNIRLDKPGMMIEENAEITVKGDPCPFVSRGGLKLAKALAVFPIDLQGKVVADIGASTGGFTDCALQNGAKKVYAIDVGYGQLDWKLRTDSRVECLERTNARFLKEDSLPQKVDFVVCDVSFISLTKIFPAIAAILKDEGQMIILIKPQFEAGREQVGKNGVVKDPLIHEMVLNKVLAEAEEYHFLVRGLDYSPIRGPEGNIEFLAWLQKSTIQKRDFDWLTAVPLLVRQAQTETE